MAQVPVLAIEGLTTRFVTSAGSANAVDGLSLHVDEGETLALVGESGCGKSVTALSILRLVPNPPGRIVSGRILLAGRDLLQMSDAEIRSVRGKDVAMIFQEPMTSLNPVYTIGRQIEEGLVEHNAVSPRAARRRAIELLDVVRLPEPHRIVDRYPHHLSGGMRQRVMIAIAIACGPKLLVADEPTTALDVTIQAQILNLLRGLQKEFRMGLLLITHDLGVVAEMAQRVVVMYAGRKVEEASVRDLFHRPQHPYTRGLLGATPRVRERRSAKRTKLTEIAGMVPSLFDMPRGCAFQPRCSWAIDRCAQSQPDDAPTGDGRRVACFVAQDAALAVR